MTPSTAAVPRRRVVAASAAVMLGAADTYVVVTILPAILAATGLDITQLNQAAPIITGFLAGYVCALPVVGRLSDLFGRVPVLLGCLVPFALGSVVTGSSNDLWEVVLGRTLQGVGGGGLVPVTLALVADRWPVQRRSTPLGAVGAAQELGSVAGPLYGAALAAAGGWRAVFYVNLPLAAALAAGIAPPRPRRRTVLRVALTVLVLLAAALAISAPPALAGDATIGVLFTPLIGGAYGSAPLPLLAMLGGAGLALRAALALHRVHTEPVDWPGAASAAVALAMVVVTFAGADPARSVVADRAPLHLGVAAVAAALFVVRELHTRAPLVDLHALRSRAATGALLVNAAAGVALIAALVDVPVLARATVAPDSQLDAALVLTRLLVAVPVGALLGGVALRAMGPRAVTTFGMLLTAAMFGVMATWDARALADPVGVAWLHASDPVLVACGLGLGLAIAPVTATMLAAVPPRMHGVAASLTVAARMVGMLVGLSLLTAIGLSRFTAAQAQLPSPATLCPRTPLDCPAFTALETGALLDDVRVIFVGAAVAALVAAACALLLRMPRRATLAQT